MLTGTLCGFFSVRVSKFPIMTSLDAAEVPFFLGNPTGEERERESNFHVLRPINQYGYIRAKREGDREGGREREIERESHCSRPTLFTIYYLC